MACRKSGTQDPKVGPGTQDPQVMGSLKVGPRTLRWDPSVRRKSSHSQLLFKISVIKRFAIFTGKLLCWNLVLIKETPTQVFSCEYCEIFKSNWKRRIKKVFHNNQTNLQKQIKLKVDVENDSYFCKEL